MAGIPGVDEPSATIGCRVRNKRTKSARSERGPSRRSENVGGWELQSPYLRQEFAPPECGENLWRIFLILIQFPPLKSVVCVLYNK